MDKVLCPHCGAENIKSSIITTCTRCLQSLEGARSAPTDLPAARATWPPGQAASPPSAPAPNAVGDSPALFTQPSDQPRTSPTTAVPGAAQLSQGVRGCGATAAIAGVALFFLFVLAGVLWVVFGARPLLVIGSGIVVIAGLAVGIYILRIRIASRFYEAVIDQPPGQLLLGESFEAGLTIRARRDMRLGDAEAVLQCEEHAISRGGTSDTHYRKTIFEQAYSLGGERDLRPGEEAALRTKITIPSAAIPTLRGKNNFIEWKLRLTVPIPGYCPDMREEFELQVRPRMAHGSARSLAKDASIPEEWLGETKVRDKPHEVRGVHAELQAADGATAQGLPAMSVGATRKLNLTLRTDEDIHCRGVLCWVGSRIHGSGTDEEVVLDEEYLIHEGDFRMAHPISHSITVSIPSSGPVTFIGRYVKCEWMVRVRVDIPLWRDKRIQLPIVVTPGLTVEREREPRPPF